MKRGLNFLKKNKKGQFYLIASVIIIVIIVGMASITNYSSNSQSSNVEKYGKELEIESSHVLDYDSVNNQDSIENFTKSFSEYIGNKINATYISGTEGNIHAYTYINGNKLNMDSNLSTGSGEIIYNYGNSEYRFNLNKGKNFYFILNQEIKGERYVYTN
jgi:hypothetical protein